MAYCGPRGLAWSEFLSWDQASRDAALLWQWRENATCSGCGTHPDDWDPGKGGSPVAFVGTVVSCPGCKAIAARQKLLDKQIEDGKQSAHARVGLRRQVEREV